MPTLEIKFAIAILIAIFRFGAAHPNIDMEVTHPERGTVAHWILVKDRGGFSIVNKEAGRLTRTGYVTTFPESPAKLQFGEPGVSPSVDLSQIIKNFNQMHFDQGESRLEAEVEGEKVDFQMTCDSNEITLFHEASKLTFKLKGRKFGF
jgi:hypothetical protein